MGDHAVFKLCCIVDQTFKVKCQSCEVTDLIALTFDFESLINNATVTHVRRPRTRQMSAPTQACMTHRKLKVYFMDIFKNG